MFESPVGVVGCCCEGAGGFSVFDAGTRRLLVRANEMFALISAALEDFQSLNSSNCVVVRRSCGGGHGKRGAFRIAHKHWRLSPEDRQLARDI